MRLNLTYKAFFCKSLEISTIRLLAPTCILTLFRSFACTFSIIISHRNGARCKYFQNLSLIITKCYAMVSTRSSVKGSRCFLPLWDLQGGKPHLSKKMAYILTALRNKRLLISKKKQTHLHDNMIILKIRWVGPKRRHASHKRASHLKYNLC